MITTKILRHNRRLLFSQARMFSQLSFDPKVDYYKILEVRDAATQQEIKNHYFRLCQFYHPDKAGGAQDLGALAKFQEINEAYNIVGNE